MSTDETKEGRLAILRDVLETLDRKTIIKGTYLSVDTFEYNESIEDKQLQKILPLIENPGLCRVCALGAIFLSHVRLHNDYVPSYHLGIRPLTFNFLESDRLRVTGALEKFFSQEQLSLIEASFEGYDSIRNFRPISDRLFEKAMIFYKAHTDLEGRVHLKKIIENMLENDGIFVLP